MSAQGSEVSWPEDVGMFDGSDSNVLVVRYDRVKAHIRIKIAPRFLTDVTRWVIDRESIKETYTSLCISDYTLSGAARDTISIDCFIRGF